QGPTARRVNPRRSAAEQAAGGLESGRIDLTNFGNQVSTSPNEGERQLQQDRRPGGRPRDRPVERLSIGGQMPVQLGAAGQDGDVAQPEGTRGVLQERAFPAAG